MPKLIVTGPKQAAREYNIDRPLVIGRNPDNDIYVNEEVASRTHCTVKQERDVYIVEDMNSSNGTRVNDKRITAHLLKHGDVISIGATNLQFHDEESYNRRTERSQRPAADIIQAVQAAEKTKPKGAISPTMLYAIVIAGAVVIALLIILAIKSFTKEKPVEPGVELRQKPPAAIVENKIAAIIPAPPVRTEVAEVPPPPVHPREKPPLATVPASSPRPAAPPAPAAPALEEEVKNVLAERDRAIARSNFLAARTVLRNFLREKAAAAPEVVTRIQTELAETEKLIDAALELTLNEAREAAKEKKYPAAAQRCTSLISSDPRGKFGSDARTLMAELDQQAFPQYEEFRTKINLAIQGANIEKAASLATSALETLGGTRWASPLSTQQLQIIVARKFLDDLEAARAKWTTLPVLKSERGEGRLLAIRGLMLEIDAVPAPVNVPLQAVDPADFTKYAATFRFDSRHSELAYLWLTINRAEAAQAELERALQVPGQAEWATRAAAALSKSNDFRLYDFSDWQQQLEWEALSGRWLTRGQRYILESPEGGDTQLRTDKLGELSGTNTNVSFDFELTNTQGQFFFAVQFGTAQKSLETIFQSGGVSVQGIASQSGVATWQSGPTHVAMSFAKDALELSINGAPPKTIAADGLSDLKGALTFHIRDAECAIDNVVVRKGSRK